jgi:hypothetical protein
VSFHPDAVVTERENGLVSGLLERGWRIELSDSYFTLLVPGTDSIPLTDISLKR